MTTEKIKARIRENLRGGRERHSHPGKVQDLSEDKCHMTFLQNGAMSGSQQDAGKVPYGLLWKYGLRYAKIIKKVPILESIAEKFYWRLANRRQSSYSSPLTIGATDMISGYGRFLEQLSREGLKGRIKLSIFRIIGFFAWWQEQINASFLRELNAQKMATDEAAVRLDAIFQELSAHRRTIDSLADSLAVELKDVQHVIRDVKRELTGVNRRVELQGRELDKERITCNLGAPERVSKQKLPLYDHIYAAFEDKFRGPRELIKERQSQYIDYIQKAYEGSKGEYLLDVGCGRGEMLELLAGSIPSKGIDVNEESVHVCTEHGLNAEQADALQFLGAAQDDSLIGVTAIQVAEHLATDDLAELIKLAYQKIKAGGLIILETVNPYSIFSLRNFFIDLTHIKPIPPETLRFLVEASGFVNTSVKYSSPVAPDLKLSGEDENTKKLNDLLFGFQDYAIIGWK